MAANAGALSIEQQRAVSRWASISVWFYAFGYFACYVPYSALTKALSSGLIHGVRNVPTGLEMLPVSIAASTLSMVATISALGWWKYPNRVKVGGVGVPIPGVWTGLSGLATAGIIATTTLAYTFNGVSIPFVMLLLRGGVLAIAPVVDRISGRKVSWYSYVALSLSFLALLEAVSERGGFRMPLLCGVDIAFYLLGYVVRLRFMTRLAKSDDLDQRRRYFVEEQMVATPVCMIVLGVAALAGVEPIRQGFVGVWNGPAAIYLVLIGVFSQGTGVFGGLILLDARENTFCVPLNRASSILGGVCAAFALSMVFPRPWPAMSEVLGASVLVMAILVLWVGPRLGKWTSKAQA